MIDFIVRKARAEDADIMAYHLLLAMEDIVYHFIGKKSSEKAIQFLTHLIQKETNQYSYENGWVVEIENEIAATAIVYEGSKLQELRAPVAATIKTMFNKDFNPEDETQTGEFYIDSVGVSQHQQGKGIGSQLLQFLIDEYVFRRNETLGLLVDKDNPNAKKLYVKLGFEIMGKKTLAEKEMEHLQFKNKKQNG